MPSRSQHNHDRTLYALLGFLLGLGAPVGWLVLRTLVTQQAWLLPWVRQEIAQSGDIYAYMAVGTVTAFTIFGFVLGRHSDNIAEVTDAVWKTLEQEKILAVTDALTDIPNARYLHDYLTRELESAKRYQTPLACLMLDIDNFKAINDTHGHPFGDAVLATLAKVFRQAVRRVDIVGRLGGEEFLVIMPHTSSDTAVRIAERIRVSVEKWPFVADDFRVPVTVSVGVAYFPSEIVSDKGELLKAADDALYQAKRAGKNKTVLASAAAHSEARA